MVWFVPAWCACVTPRMPRSPSKAVSIWPTNAAHALSLAALRWHGYRSENRYLVFQCLEHTIGLENAQWRVLDQAHKQRNLAEYEGDLDVDDALVTARAGGGAWAGGAGLIHPARTRRQDRR
jgi:hypothetical protein